LNNRHFGLLAAFSLSIAFTASLLIGCDSKSGPVELTPRPSVTAEETQMMEDREKQMKDDAASYN